MTDNGRVLVVGGTGMLGGQVVSELLARGKRVRALVRPTSDAKRLESNGVEIARGDMMDPASLLQAMDGADAVVSTAAGYTRHSKGDTDEIDIIGNQHLADAAHRAGVNRFVLTSILTCDQTPQVPHFWHKKFAEDRLEDLGVPFVALRPGAFLNMITQMGGDPFTKRRLMWFGSPTIPAYLCAHPGLGRLSRRRCRRTWCGRAAYRHRLGPARQHGGDRTDFRTAARREDPSVEHSGPLDQHGRGGGRQVQSHDQGHDRNDAVVPDRPVRGRYDAAARGVWPGAHRGGCDRQADTQSGTHHHR
jgi:hypothetical protein